jgi:hypothetical protein
MHSQIEEDKGWIQQLENLRLSQDFHTSGPRPDPAAVPVCWPSKNWFFRVHTNPDYQLNTHFIYIKESRTLYLVQPSLVPSLNSLQVVLRRTLCTAITQEGLLFLWPIRDKRERPVKRAARHWIRLDFNPLEKRYEIDESCDQLGVPLWPMHSFQTILNIAFANRYIQTLDHPVLVAARETSQ